jgi:hypothetical protein
MTNVGPAFSPAASYSPLIACNDNQTDLHLSIEIGNAMICSAPIILGLWSFISGKYPYMGLKNTQALFMFWNVFGTEV